MYIDMKKRVKVGCNFYCAGCRELKVVGQPRPYCDITGEYLDRANNGNILKSDKCLKTIKEQLKNG